MLKKPPFIAEETTSSVLDRGLNAVAAVLGNQSICR